MLVHVDFETSLLKLFDILLNLDKHFVGSVNLVLIVEKKTLIGKFDYLFEYLFGFSCCDLRLDGRKDQSNLSFFNIIYFRSWRLAGRFRLYFLDCDSILLLRAIVLKGGFGLMAAGEASHDFVRLRK